MSGIAQLVASGGYRYAAWDSANKNAAVTLSGGNLTATSASEDCGVRSTIGVSSGKWYWEVTGVDNDGSGFADSVGIATSTYAFAVAVGADGNGWGYVCLSGTTPLKYNNGSTNAYGVTFAKTDVIGIALDLSAGTLTFYKNNASQGTAFSSLSGTFYAAISMCTNATSRTANFGPGTVYAPPAGHNRGLYS